MGVVYRAFDVKLRRTVALKFLLDPDAVSDEVKQRFMREAMASSALEHSNIGTLHAIEETSDGKLFLVMACYEGHTLARRMASGPIPLNQAISITLQLLRGLDEAHNHGIVHRDIKPGNLIFNSQGVLKILDFGLAKLHGSPDLTQPGSTMGTIAYMAPEQATSAAVDHRADLWSAGVVLYELIAGRRLFQGADLVSTLYAVISKEPDPLPGLPPGLDGLLNKALQKDPGRRYQSAKQMIRELEGVLGTSSQPEMESEPATTIGPELAARPLSGTEARHRKHWLLGIATVVLVVAGVAAWLVARRSHPALSGNRVAVLPLTATVESPAELASAQALADGLRSQLIRSLASLEPSNPDLLVVPSSQLASQHVTGPASARSTLGLGTVLTGSFRESGERVQVVLSSVDTADSKVLRLEKIDGATSDLPALEKEMFVRAVKLLRLKSVSQPAAGGRPADLPPDQMKIYLTSLGYLERWGEAGNLDAAIQGLTSLIGNAPKFAPGYAGLANCYLRRYQGTRDAKALELADQNATLAAQLDGSLPEVALGLGQVRALQGNYPEAVSHFQQALAADPRSDGAYRGLAQAYASMGLPDKAEREWQQAIDLRPNSVDAYNQLGIFAMGRGDYASAAANFRKASALAPQNASILGNLGAALAYAGSAVESRRALQQSIRLGPSAPAWNNLGDLDLKQGRFADAAADYEQALEFNKADYRVWSNMAVAYSRTPGQRDKAKDAFLHAAQMCRETLKTNPNAPVALSDLAMFVASEGDERQEPLVLIERALALAPEDTNVQFNAAETYEALGYRKDALDWVAKLVAAGYPIDDINDSPVLADLVKDSRYQTIVRDEGKKPASDGR